MGFKWFVWIFCVLATAFLVAYTIIMYRAGDIGAFWLVVLGIVYAYMVKLMFEVLGELLRGEPWI